MKYNNFKLGDWYLDEDTFEPIQIKEKWHLDHINNVYIGVLTPYTPKENNGDRKKIFS